MSRFLVFSLVLAATAGYGPSLFAQDAPAGAASVEQTESGTVEPMKPGDRSCLRSTDSLITPRKGGCLPVPGHSYSRDEILRTGSPDTAGALRQLDPSIQVRGH